MMMSQKVRYMTGGIDDEYCIIVLYHPIKIMLRKVAITYITGFYLLFAFVKTLLASSVLPSPVIYLPSGSAKYDCLEKFLTSFQIPYFEVLSYTL